MLTVSEGRVYHAIGRPQGEALGLVLRQRDEGNCRQEPLLWFPQGGMDEAGSAGLGLASANNFSGLWDIGGVLSVWFLGLG